MCGDEKFNALPKAHSHVRKTHFIVNFFVFYRRKQNKRNNRAAAEMSLSLRVVFC